MQELKTDLGRVLVGTRDALFRTAADMLVAQARQRKLSTIGLPGGSTPQAWFKWMVDNKALGQDTLKKLFWLASDERFVPLESPESNFGNAARHLLDPLEVPEEQRMPWPTQVDPYSAGIVFNRRWNDRFGAQHCFDICLLGMGDDGHTASIFPMSPLLSMETPDNFASVEVRDKGWRLSVTPAGLERSRQIVLLVVGESKAERLKSVLQGPDEPLLQPVQSLRPHADKTVWLVDEAAAAQLSR